jgi:hypothetical protein
MAEYWQLKIAKWNLATDDMTLELEGALLRVVNATRLYDRPIKANLRVLSGLWRCNERRAKRILSDLVATGEIRIEDGLIINERAVDEASNYNALRVERASNGHKGGIESGKSRRKALKNKEQDEAVGSTIKEKKRREDIVGGGNAGARDPDPPEPPPASQPDPQDKTSERELLLLSMHCDPTGLTGPNGKIIGTLADMRHVQRWKQDLGLSLQDILTVVAEVMATKREPGPPSSFLYFEQAMCRAAGASEPIQPQQNGDQDGQPQSPYQTGKRTGVDRPASGQRRASEGLVSGFSRALSDINR